MISEMVASALVQVCSGTINANNCILLLIYIGACASKSDVVRTLSFSLLFSSSLLHTGTINKAEIESTYKISRRIEAEERSLEGATTVFTSTQQEIDEQWGLYDA